MRREFKRKWKVTLKKQEENMYAKEKGTEKEKRLNNLLIIFYIILNLINLIFFINWVNM